MSDAPKPVLIRNWTYLLENDENARIINNRASSLNRLRVTNCQWLIRWYRRATKFQGRPMSSIFRRRYPCGLSRSDPRRRIPEISNRARYWGNIDCCIWKTKRICLSKWKLPVSQLLNQSHSRNPQLFKKPEPRKRAKNQMDQPGLRKLPSSDKNVRGSPILYTGV